MGEACWEEETEGSWPASWPAGSPLSGPIRAGPAAGRGWRRLVVWNPIRGWAGHEEGLWVVGPTPDWCGRSDGKMSWQWAGLGAHQGGGG